ncbi:glutamine synthetase/guanido kinase [Sparassis latifolia]|uniref:Glutamine synthetase n=1 Tax=Sparassis crispa TaxID=139825 RepID=A0A401GMM0_9APHY|nr:Protein fluG [Sparassis crispa]GBE83430.1 Protein fluG [Sparassis crispa]
MSPPAAATDYGVLYKPTKPAELLSADRLHSICQAHDIRYIRVQWVDLVNTVRFRVLPRKYFVKLLSSSRPGVCLAKTTLGIIGCSSVPGFSGTGEYLYVPDLSSFRICPYAPGHASVMGWFQEKTAAPNAGLTVDLCPRTLLNRIVEEALAKAGLAFLAGFESEFILLKATSPTPIAVNNADWSCSSKFPSGSVEAKVLEEIAHDLLEGGIELQMYHAEAAPGQYEVVTGPLAPLEAADAVVFTRETIYNVAAKHGLRATFAPRLHSDNCGSGAHMHLSMHSSRMHPPPVRPDTDASLAPTLTLTERSFLQSWITHLPALCALTLPTAASYARVLDGIWSGGTYACWGTDNRETPIRLCGPPHHHHFEMKCGDATANPYLVLAGVIAVGVHGILDGALLSVGDCLKPVFQMDEGERRAVGLDNPGRLPGTIADARKLLAQDEVLGAALGEGFVEKYLVVNEELETFLKAETEQATVTRLLEYY